MKNRVNRVLVCLLAVVMLVGLLPLSASAATANFTPNPTTTYAKDFVSKCEGQQWFLNAVEKILNQNQKTINNLGSASDLNIIKSLGLKDAGITGGIPTAISELKDLRYLFLSGNHLSGAIPTALFSMPKLQNIDLTGNSYAGAIPDGFGTMPALVTLSLRGNQYTGTIPATILSNRKINFLDVSSNKLSGPIPAGLNGMTQLIYLAVSVNPWTAGPLPSLAALTNLKGLSAWNAKLIGPIPTYLYTLTSLQVLDLDSNQLTGPISPDIKNLVNLQLLSLGNNQLSGTVPPGSLGALTQLQVLDISNNKLRGYLPEDIKNIPVVYAENNYMTGDVLASLVNNAGNFCDGATTNQFQLTAPSPQQISTTTVTNLYSYLKNVGVGVKPLLPADCYTVTLNDPTGKVTLTQDANGIYVIASGDIAVSDGVTVTITILDNDGSVLSSTTITLTTEVTPTPTPTPSPGGGGSTPNPNQTQVVHEPYITGFPDGTFRPNDPISREQVAAMVTRALGLTLNTTGTSSYIDVGTDRWSLSYIETMKDYGYMIGYEDGAFRPNYAMTRAELATCLVRIAVSQGKEVTGDPKDFTDVSPGAWYTSSIRQASALGLIEGYDDGTFRPNATVTRAEAVTMMNRLLGRDPATAPTLQTIPCPFSDIDATHWAYWQVMEASVEHPHGLVG